MVVTTAQHTAQQTRRGPAHGRVRLRRSGQAPMGGGLLPPVIATAVGARGRFRHRQRRPTRLGRTPIEGATPELEPVDRDAITTRGFPM